MIDHILLFGSTGMLGRYIFSYFKNHPTIRLSIVTNDEFRVTEQSIHSLCELFIKYSVNEHTCVINCIGQIPQRIIGQSDRIYYLINSLFPHLLWNTCKLYGSKMIQPTTDCVFSGTKGSYTEMDEHDEMGAYGISKSLGEPSDCTIIRTSIIGNELRNKKSLLEWVLSNNNKTINGWTNHNWNGITCLQYCKVIEAIIIEDLFWSGVRHILSPKDVSKYELSRLICDTYNCNITINPVETETKVDKTLQSIYPVNNLFKIPDLSVQIKELRNYLLIE